MISRRILIIDDEPHVQEVAAMSLRVVARWEVYTVNSGAEGIAAAQEIRPDAILLDVMMPGLDGPATLRSLQESAGTRDIPVLFLTAKARQVDHGSFTDLGAKGAISKPFDPVTLATEIAEALGWAE